MDSNELFPINFQDTSDSDTACSSANVTPLSVPLSVNTKNKKPSLVTPYFIKKSNDDSVVACVICKNTFSKKTATGNLRKHLDSQHPGWNIIELFALTNTISAQSLTTDQKARFNTLLAEWIVSDTLPFSTVKSKALIALLRYLNASLELPLHGDVQALFGQISSRISITLDIWTSRATYRFLVLQHIKSTVIGTLKKILIDIRMLPHPHTGEDIEIQLRSILDTFDITMKSSMITQDFKEIGLSVGEDEAVHKIPQNVSTSNLAQYKLTEQEDFDLQAVIRFLRPFYETTNTLSGSTYVTFGLSILLIDDIVDIITSCIQDSSSPLFLKTAATQMSKKVKQYMVHIYNKAAFMASILDPRIKLELIPVDMNTLENQNFFNQIFQEYLSNNLSTNLAIENVLTMTIYAEQVAQKRRRVNAFNTMNEVTQYLNEATLPMSINPLEW
ncbi:7584_t:CDS:2 [Racocetra persica]|uniref:7584_t:CDS:1 n=1 Tax=Racocetra persica TaxID=160502 RepID=A0ACA9Q0S7_9GLOM|nr:7584_t:CDS:2 [Racocetra persica]